MGWECNKCKNKRHCEESTKTGELVKCNFEPLDGEMVDKFCEDLIKDLVEWRKPNRVKSLMELVAIFDEYVEVNDD